MLLTALPDQQRRQQQRQHRQRHPGIPQRHHKPARIEQGERQRRQEGDRPGLHPPAQGAAALEQIGKVIEQAQRHAEERGCQGEVGKQVHCQLHVRRRNHFTQGLQQPVQAGVARQHPHKGRRVDTAEGDQLPEDIGHQRDGAAGNKNPAQLAHVAIHIADDARHAAVKTERGKNHRDGRQRQPFLQRQGQ